MGNPINDKLYAGRQDFCVVALTGVLGSGFEELNQLISSKERLMAAVRSPQVIAETIPTISTKGSESEQESKEAIQRNLFYRKYSICHKYASSYYAPFKILKYNQVLWFYTLKKFVNSIARRKLRNPGEELKTAIQSLIDDKYSRYNFPEGDSYDRYGEINNITDGLLQDILGNWDDLYNCIHDTPNFLVHKNILQQDKIAAVFFDENNPFNIFYRGVREKMLKTDYFLYCMFYWRLGISIRATGDPKRSMRLLRQEQAVTKCNRNIFGVVRLISTLIRGYHKNVQLHNQTNGCRICIDSLRNSFEAKYLQERFSAFYLINVYNNNENIIHTIKQNVHRNNGDRYDENRLKLIEDATYCLFNKEAKSEVSVGHLAMHDVDTCIANAEIHITYKALTAENIELINNPNGLDDERADIRKALIGHAKFYYLAEQWMKYATLIQRPGLFTPDTDERCMQIAYTAKFNSGCISRQVGAVITNQDGSIRTIGWNDPPYGQVPCSLRDIRDISSLQQGQTPHFNLCTSYSDFELGGKFEEDGRFKEDLTMSIYDDSKKNFVQKVRSEFAKIPNEYLENIDTLPYPLCFKKCHTTWITKEAGNSFHQRAIHAEENAMMQMVKYGGESLKGGVIYVTASPCEICSKKLYQIGVRKIIYIDPYPGIARNQVIENGFLRPELVYYEGVYGATYFKLYSHFIDYKDELEICGLGFPPKLQ